MRRRHDNRGATLSLVVVTTLVIMVLGMGIFFLTKLLGGARELQNATDSGNLNVAKQSLRNPPLKLFSNGPYDLSGPRLAMVQQNFSQLKDPQTGELDLLTYNRAVGQAMLVAMNASSDFGLNSPNPLGISDSKTLIDCLANPNDGLGAVLANKLKSDTQMDLNFTNLANLSNLRMLRTGTGAGVISSVKDISYMAPNTATNLQLNPASIPPQFLAANQNFIANNIVSQAGSTFLKGYSFINIPSITDNSTYPLMGVPLRPLANPHLVSDFDFKRLSTTPLAGQSNMAAASRIPPNAFKSGGLGNESHQNKFMGMQSCAITGTVAIQGQYTASIPCGFIVVANGPGVTPTNTAGSVNTVYPAKGLSDYAYGGGGRDIFSDVLMYNTVYVTANGAMSQDPQKIIDIQNWKNQQAQAGQPQSPVPSNLANALDGPSPKQSYADGIQPNETPAACNNSNSVSGEPGFSQKCVNELPSMASVYGTNLPSQGGSPSLTNLMALEKEKAEIINPRPSGGPAVVSDLPAPGVCTGLKSFPFSEAKLQAGQPQIGSNLGAQFATSGSIKSLLDSFQQYSGTQSAYSQISTTIGWKLRQIKPTATQSEIDSALANAQLPMGEVRYIWLDSNTNQFKVTDASSLPNYINISALLPDGSKTSATTGDLPVDGQYVNLSNEQNFPHPWDCNGTASYRNTIEWTNSSGFNCLQGVLRFSNCATDAGAPWHCPC